MDVLDITERDVTIEAEIVTRRCVNLNGIVMDCKLMEDRTN